MLYLLTLALSLTAYAQNLLIKSAHVIDGTGAPASSPQDVEVKNGKISRIGVGLKSPGARVIDGSGKYLMPGLIDTHTHLASVPGSLTRKDSAAVLEEQRRVQMKAYLAAGVTTVLDCAAPLGVMKSAKKIEADGGPRVLGLAPFLTPKGGYFGEEERDEALKELWPPVSTAEEIRAQIAEALPYSPVGVKVTMEDGFGPLPVWKTFDESQRRAIVDAAAAAGLPVYAHSMTAKEHREALTLKPYALVHSGFAESDVDEDVLGAIKDSGAYVMSTLAIYKLMGLMWDQEALKDPWLVRLVPPLQLATARDPSTVPPIIAEVSRVSSPTWMPGFITRWIGGLFMNRKATNKMLVRTGNAVKRMHERGIPIVMGSDSGNWAVWTTFFHGVGTVFEMEALREVGVPASEAIVMATSRAAKMIRRDGEIGKVSVGLTADLILLNQDPHANERAYRDLAFVIKGGVAKTPDEWLK